MSRLFPRTVLAAALLLVAGLTGCGGSQVTEISTTPAALTLSVSSFSFGNQPVGTSSLAQTVMVTNTGGSPLTVSSLTVTGTNAAAFAETSTCSTAPLSASASCTVSVTFAPTSAGAASATVSLSSNAAGSQQAVTLSGTGTVPGAVLSATSLSFGTQLVNTTSASQSITLTNTGLAPLTVGTVSIAGSGFSLSGAAGCTVLAPGAACTVSVTFTPSSAVTSAATLSFTDNAAGSPQVVTLSGTGVAPTASVSSSSLSFGNQPVTTASVVQTVTVTNTGSSPLTISSVAVTGTNAAAFAETSTCAAPLAASASCTVSVTFTPTAAGPASATVILTDNAAGSPQSITLSGTGTVPVATLSATSLNFGTQLVNTTSGPQSVTLTNTGLAPLTVGTVSIAGTGFSLSGAAGCAVLASGAVCTIPVTFTPTSTTVFSATLNFTDNAAGSPQIVTLSGTGVVPMASLSTSSLAFGSQPVATTSAAQTVTVTNTGGSPLTISSVAVTGTNAAAFAVTSTCAAPLAASASCTVSVTFAPASAGPASATLTLTDNAAGSPQSITLSGTGTVPVAALSASSLTFGTQIVNTTSASQSVTLTNTGLAPLTVGTVLIAGAGFSLSGATTCAVLAPGAACTIPVTFTPTSTSVFSATLNFTDNAAGSPQGVTLSGTGVLPTVTASVSTLTFAAQTVNTTSAAQTITLTNTSAVPLSISSVALIGTNAAYFAKTTTCGATLAAAGTCMISVAFTPGVAGSATAAITVTDNAATSPQMIALSGSGAVPSVGLSVPSLAFTVQAVNTTSAPQSVTLTNTSTVPLVLTSIAIAGTNVASFASSTTCGATLAPAATCMVSVTFTPAGAGPATGSIVVTDNAGNSPQSIALSGTGALPAISFTPSALVFAAQAAGTTSSPQTITVTNTGAVPVNLTSIGVLGLNAAVFQETSTCGNTLAPAVSCTVNVSFAPTVAGTPTASIAVADNVAGSPQSIPLSGTAVTPALTFSSTALTFPSQYVGATSASQKVTLTNSGSVPVSISSVALAGTNPGEFSAPTTCAGALAPAASCTITVAFTPNQTGAATANIAVADNAPNSPQTIALSSSATTVLTLTKVSSTEWDASNGIVSFQFNPTNFSVSNLKVIINGVTTNFLDPTTGASPFGHAIGLYNLGGASNVTAAGPSSANYYNNGTYLDMWSTFADAPGTDPLEVENHWVIRVGDLGMHFYQVLRHRAYDGATLFGAATTNFFASSNAVTQADGTTVYYAYNLGRNNPGPTVETFPPVATSSALVTSQPGRQVQAETQDFTATTLGDYVSMPGLKREFITKYNYSTYQEYHQAHGEIGQNTAFWWVVPSSETFIGGPTKQYLSTIQLEYSSAHEGGAETAFAAGEVRNHLFGPYYIHFNGFNGVNTTQLSLYNDAVSTIPSCLNFYDTETILQSNGYVPRPSRGTLQAKIASPVWSASAADNMVMLTDNSTYFQESANNYQYWGYADASGNVTIPNVMPGTYRLTSYIDGQWGLFHQDNVVITGDQTTTVTAAFAPRNFSTQPPIWTIGIPDRSAHEFVNGHNAAGGDVRDYLAIGNYWQFLTPGKGALIYNVANNDWATTWPFIHFGHFYPNLYAGVYGGATTGTNGYDYITPQYVKDGAVTENKTPATFSPPNWEVHFTTTAAQLAQGPYAIVSINTAAVNTASLQVQFNGKHSRSLLWYGRLGSDPDVRSGVAGYNNYVVFELPTSDLNPAGQDNVMTLYSTGAIMYDALKLEIGPASANPSVTGWPEYDWMHYVGSSSTQQSASAP
jgi:hypothetical protein